MNLKTQGDSASAQALLGIIGHGIGLIEQLFMVEKDEALHEKLRELNRQRRDIVDHVRKVGFMDRSEPVNNEAGH